MQAYCINKEQFDVIQKAITSNINGSGSNQSTKIGSSGSDSSNKNSNKNPASPLLYNKQRKLESTPQVKASFKMSNTLTSKRKDDVMIMSLGGPNGLNREKSHDKMHQIG